MAIEWFPGHMASARKKAAETMGKIDVVVEVLDARLPGASSNPMIERLRMDKQRPCLKVLNKADLADPQATRAWLAHFSAGKGVRAVAISSKKRDEVARIPALAASLVPHRDSPLKPVRMMVMGVPNVGKSTLINALLKRKASPTGDEPAVTRQQSRFSLDERHELIDTPGLIAPAIHDERAGMLLAASHLIGPDAYDEELVAAYLADVLLARYPALVRTRYDVDPLGLDGHTLLRAIARHRGFLMKGGAPSLNKAARALLSDYRSGRLGRLTLESPPVQ